MEFRLTSMVTNLVTVFGLQIIFSLCPFYLCSLCFLIFSFLISPVNTGARQIISYLETVYL